MHHSMKSITKTAMMAAIIFLCTCTFKIPIAITGGYTHLGDCAIFLGVLLLGKKKGALAAALGAALADLMGGFPVWILPTLLIKGLMAYSMGALAESRLSARRFGCLWGALAGGVLQIAGYTLVKILLISPAAGIATIPTVTLQTLSGIGIAAVLITFLQTSHILYRIKEL